MTFPVLLLLALTLTGCGKSQAAKDADALIAGIGTVSLESGPKLEAAEQAVSALSAEDKEQLEGSETLKTARETYNGLVQEAANAEEAAAVEAAIAAIGEVTLESEKDIDAARKVWNAAPAEVRALVTNAALLDEAGAALLERKAAPVSEAIAAIGEVTLESAEAIDAARKIYDDCEPEVKALVQNAGDLDAAAEKLSSLRVGQVEEAIAAIGEVTLESAEAIQTARDAYDALSKEDAAKVQNAGDLTAADERIAALKKEQGEAMLANFYHQYDQVTAIDWYYPKAYPYYTADNLWGVDIRSFVLPYIGRDKNGRMWMRLVCHYYGDDWIFFERAIFSIDGENQVKSFKRSDINRDHDGGYVWETADIAADSSEQSLMWDIVNSTQTIVRLEGNYIHDITVSDTDKTAMREILTCFEALNG